MSEDVRTIQRDFQTPFIKLVPSLQPFEYTGDCSRVEGLEKPLGDVSFTDCMDSKSAGGFREDSTIRARPGNVGTSLVMKKSVAQLISAEEWEECVWHLDIRTQFEPPRSEPLNWVHIDRVCNARFTGYTTDGETTFTRDESGEVLVTMPLAAPPLHLYHIRLLETALVDSNKAGDITVIAKAADAVCPSTETGPAVGCVLVAGTAAIAGNPYFGKSTDGGATWTWTQFDGANDTPTWTGAITGIDAQGDLIIAVSATDTAHAVSQDGGTTWSEIVLADYAANAPQSVVIATPTAIWIVGANGYIWKSTNSGLGATTANGGDAGVVTASNLVRIKALHDRFAIAVGASNAIVMTQNGGLTWSLVTGPAAQAAIQVNSLAIRDQYMWLLVYEDGEGWWTDDQGASWDEDDQLSGLSLTALNDIIVCVCDRWLLVGEDASGLAYMAQNVHGAPDKWQRITVSSDIQELFQVACCDINAFVAVGEVTYVGAEGAIVRAVG